MIRLDFLVFLVIFCGFLSADEINLNDEPRGMLEDQVHGIIDKDKLSAQIDQEIEAHQNIIKELQILRKTIVDEDWNFNIMRSLTFKYDSVYLELAEKANATYTTMMQYFNNADPNYFHAEVSMVRRKKRLEGNGFPWKSYTERTVFDDGMAFHKSDTPRKAYDLFMESWRIYNMSVNFKVPFELGEVYILDYIQYSAGQLGRYGEALWLCQRAASLETDQKERMQGLVKHWENQRKAGRVFEMTEEEKNKFSKALESNEENYELCLDENANKIDWKLSEDPSLFCRYSDRGRHPLLILSPVKEEFLNLDPMIIRFYNLISYNEGQMLKKDVHNELSIAMVQDPEQGNIVNLEERVTETAFLWHGAYPKMMARFKAITNFNFDGSEFQVGFYTTGGHFLPHNDAFDVDNETSIMQGNRIATLLMYLNQPEEGGGTIFTNAGVRVMPIPGSGVLWFNIVRNGAAEVRTQHGACPVTAGSKWISNLV